MLPERTHQRGAGKIPAPGQLGVHRRRTGGRGDVIPTTASSRRWHRDWPQQRAFSSSGGQERNWSGLKCCKIRPLVFGVERSVRNKALLDGSQVQRQPWIASVPGISCGRQTIACPCPNTEHKPTPDPKLRLAGPALGYLQAPRNRHGEEAVELAPRAKRPWAPCSAGR